MPETRAQAKLLLKNHFCVLQLIPIGRITQGDIKKRCLCQYGPMVTEGVKTKFAMVGAHAAVPNAAKGHAGICQVYHGIIDAAAPRCCLGQDHLFLFPA